MIDVFIRIHFNRWGCDVEGIFDLLIAARLQSFVSSSQKDFRLSSAALGRLNIYLTFIGGGILAKAQKRRRTFLSCISAPEGAEGGKNLK